MFEGSFLSVQNSELRIFFSFNTKGCHSHAFIVSDDCSPLCKSFLLPLIALKAFFLSLDSSSLAMMGLGNWLCIYSAWNLLQFVDLVNQYVSPGWRILDHYHFQHLCCPISSLLAGSSRGIFLQYFLWELGRTPRGKMHKNVPHSQWLGPLEFLTYKLSLQ